MSNQEELARQIEVMTAYKNGQEIEGKLRDISNSHSWDDISFPEWNWAQVDYRVKEAKRYKLGSLFYDKDDGEAGDKYILCQVEADKYCLISLKSGNRWNDPVKIVESQPVKIVEFQPAPHWATISEDAFDEVCGGAEFVEVSK